MNPRDSLFGRVLPEVEPFVAARPAWQASANCAGVDPSVMYPGQGESVEPAKQVCAECVVRAECLEYALVNRERFGVWGGLTDLERRPLRRQRGARTTKELGEANRAAIAPLWDDGCSRTEIAEATGLAYNTVTEVIRGLLREEAS